jgi:integrase/recombinase XerD
MAISSTITFNKQRIKPDGTATVYLQVIIDSKRELISMDFSWPADLISKTMLLPRFKNDEEATDYMIVITSELNKINEISRLSRLANRDLTMQVFKNEYRNFENKGDFSHYMAEKIKYRYDKGIIRESTKNSHIGALNAMNLFQKPVIFNQISRQMMEDLKAYMLKKLNYDSDTVLTRLKCIRTYMNQAIEDGHIFTYPFGKGFKMPADQRRIEYLDEAEFATIKKYFYGNNLVPGSIKEQALRCYLFLCYTGIRISDFIKLTHANIKKEVLYFEPVKAKTGNNYNVEIPLHPEARKLINTQKGKLFIHPSEASLRKELSEIATKLEINSTCSPHTARHTFATRFLRAGGRLEVLQQLLGHEDIKSTMIYVHVDLPRKQAEMALLQ